MSTPQALPISARIGVQAEGRAWINVYLRGHLIGQLCTPADDAAAVLAHIQPTPTTPASPACTCPTGSGSLRWPCPEHGS